MAKCARLFKFVPMDSTSSRDTYPAHVYMISGDPPLPHHLATHQCAEQKIGQPVPLVIVDNAAKSGERMFSVAESVELAKKLADHLGLDIVEIFGLETREAIGQYIAAAESVVRRTELENPNLPTHVEKITQVFGVPDYPQKIYWIESDVDSQHTAGRLKSLLYVAEHHPQKSTRDICLQAAQKIAPDFVIAAVQQKLREHPERQFFLSHTPELDEVLR